MTQTVFRKRYASAEACSTAVANYSWLLGAAEPLTSLRSAAPVRTRSTLNTSRAGIWTPKSFPHMRYTSGRLTPQRGPPSCDAHAWTRPTAVPRLGRSRTSSARAPSAWGASLAEVARGPVAFYKDANIRNTLVTAAGELVTVDFDSLRRPVGYDLAKCVVSLTMTSGPLTWTQIRSAWSLYNTAAGECDRALGGTSWPAFLAMADIHALLTEPYLGRNGYIHPWRRPAHATEEQS